MTWEKLASVENYYVTVADEYAEIVYKNTVNTANAANTVNTGREIRSSCTTVSRKSNGTIV